MGRKATGLSPQDTDRVAGLPGDAAVCFTISSTSSDCASLRHARNLRVREMPRSPFREESRGRQPVRQRQFLEISPERPLGADTMGSSPSLATLTDSLSAQVYLLLVSTGQGENPFPPPSSRATGECPCIFPSARGDGFLCTE
jgi:hypothetical protein